MFIPFKEISAAKFDFENGDSFFTLLEILPSAYTGRLSLSNTKSPQFCWTLL